jgi:hypothetical protein
MAYWLSHNQPHPLPAHWVVRTQPDGSPASGRGVLVHPGYSVKITAEEARNTPSTGYWVISETRPTPPPAARAARTGADELSVAAARTFPGRPYR